MPSGCFCFLQASPHNETSALDGYFPPTFRCKYLKSGKDYCVFAPQFDEKSLAHRSRPIIR